MGAGLLLCGNEGKVGRTLTNDLVVLLEIRIDCTLLTTHLLLLERGILPFGFPVPASCVQSDPWAGLLCPRCGRERSFLPGFG